MATALTHDIINEAKGVVDSYITDANSYWEELSSLLSSLTTADFIGDGSDGYKEFFDSRVKPALTDQLTAPSGSLTANIKDILDNIQLQLMDTVDPQLGQNNRNPG